MLTFLSFVKRLSCFLLVGFFLQTNSPFLNSRKQSSFTCNYSSLRCLRCCFHFECSHIKHASQRIHPLAGARGACSSPDPLCANLWLAKGRCILFSPSFSHSKNPLKSPSVSHWGGVFECVWLWFWLCFDMYINSWWLQKILPSEVQFSWRRVLHF